MKRLRFNLKSVLALSLTAAMLGGCASAGGSDSQPANDNTTAAGQKETTGGEKVSLRFSWWGGDVRHEATLACIEAFMNENPDIEIIPEYSGFDGYQQKISAALAGGTEPDIIQLDQPWMASYMSQNPNFFLNIRDYQDTLDLSGFSEDFLNDFCVSHDKLISLPTGTNALNFLANKQVLEDAGITFGDTIYWDDLLEQGKKVNEANPENYMINMDVGTAFYITRIYLYQLTNKNLVNDDYTIGVEKEDFAKAFAFTKLLYDEKVILPFEESMIFKGSPADNPKWNNNQLGGWLMWSSLASQNTWPEGDAVSLPYPQLQGAENSGVLVRPSQVFSVSANTKHPEAAMKFLDFMFNQEVGILALKDSRSIPPTQTARELLEANGMIYPAAAQAVNLAMENLGTPESDLSSNSEVTAVMETITEKLVYGQCTAEEAAEEAYSLLSDVLANLKANAE